MLAQLTDFSVTAANPWLQPSQILQLSVPLAGWCEPMPAANTLLLEGCFMSLAVCHGLGTEKMKGDKGENSVFRKVKRHGCKPGQPRSV